jgi:hypothetical protein
MLFPDQWISRNCEECIEIIWRDRLKFDEIVFEVGRAPVGGGSHAVLNELTLF